MLLEIIAVMIAAWVGIEWTKQRASTAVPRALLPCQTVCAKAAAAMNKPAVIRTAEKLRILIEASSLKGVSLPPRFYAI
jgi:hypothetical protein